MAHVGREGRLGSSKAPGRTLQLVQCPACLGSGRSAEMQLLGEEIRQATSLCLCSLEPGWALFWLPFLFFGISRRQAWMSILGCHCFGGMVEVMCLLSR